MKIFGLEIENKTDILALSAFLISLGTIMTNIVLMIRGPDVNIIKPDQVAIVLSQQKQGAGAFVKLVADNYFFNSATPGYDDVVSKMLATMKFSEREINLRGQYFAITDTDGEKVFERDRKPASPLLIKARQSGGAEVHYLPYTKDKGRNFDNYMRWGSFQNLMQQEKGKSINITFSYETFSGRMGKVDCNVLVTENFIRNINDKEKNRADVACY